MMGSATVSKTGDINLLSANDETSSHSDEYKKKTGLSVSGGFLSISSAKEAGGQAQGSTSVGSQINAAGYVSLQTERDINVIGSSVSGSVGYGQTNGSKNWIEEQTRITAKDKVDIRTENHTQLDGALIASDSGNLKLDTNTLGYSDIAGKDKEHG
ncbi:hemagglutinin repeat-containing protein, partial [Pseudomonas syringae pv. syringae]